MTSSVQSEHWILEYQYDGPTAMASKFDWQNILYEWSSIIEINGVNGISASRQKARSAEVVFKVIC